MSFHDRFKGKISTIGKQGLINTDNRFSLPKTEAKSPLRTSVNAILQNQKRNTGNPIMPIIEFEEEPKCMTPAPASQYNPSKKNKRGRSLPMSAQPKQKTETFSTKRHLSEIPEFTPYSLSEYKNIAKYNYYALGGLGPAYVGTKQWVSEDNKRKRREDYAKKVTNLDDRKQVSFLDKFRAQ